MIVSWNWLTQYVRLEMPVEALSERLALTGLNHESTEEVGGDLAIDLEVTSNRSDCLGHLGVAREISVLFDVPLRVPDPQPPTSGAAVETLTSVAIDAIDACSRFTARIVSGATIKESPWWLRKRLETLGVRPISNVVDVTNYVMFEVGQPLHAYDLDRLEGHRLIVRYAQAGEKLTAINAKIFELTPEMLVIADAKRPVGLAGVMGGLDTEIGPTHEEYSDRGRALRHAFDPENRARTRAFQSVELSLRASARSRGGRVGRPSLCRADPGHRRRDAPPWRDRSRAAPSSAGGDHASARPDSARSGNRGRWG